MVATASQLIKFVTLLDCQLMSNRQVEDALNDYFSELLGTADIEDNKTDVSTADQIEQEKLDSKPIKDLLDTVSGDVFNTSIPRSDQSLGLNESAGLDRDATIRAQRQTTDKPDTLETQKNRASDSSVEVDSYSIADDPKVYLSSHSLVSSKVESLFDLPPLGNKSGDAHTNIFSKIHTTSKPVAKTDVDANAHIDHKGRLERMLKQVSSLTANQNTSLKHTALEKGRSSSPYADAKGGVNSPLEPIALASTAAPIEHALISAPSAAEQASGEEISVEKIGGYIPVLGNQWHKNGRPEWAQEKFDILLLEVNGLQLAVPLTTLGQIHEMNESITPLFGQSNWFMGLQKTSDGNVKVVNTAELIMPERHRDQHNYKYVITIHDLYWGLAVDDIKQPITISPEAIRWRPKRDSRPWMAGIVKDHMCVLLDIPKIGEILQAQDKNRHA
jgi:purine-binding chemotaxis protein CheW